MFESTDDIDDEFLNGVFDNDIVEFESAHSSTRINNQRELISRREPVPWLCPDKDETDTLLQNSKKTEVPNNAENWNSSVIPTLDTDENALHGNKENKRKYVYSPIPLRAKRERKFPGPAGLLPDRKLSRGSPLKIDSILEADKSPPHSSTGELCSQGQCSGSVLEEEPWQTLLADLGPDRNILDVVNVANIKRKAAARCFVGKKVPFLAAVLHHLDVSSPDPCIILRDGTGEIHGTLHREVWDQFAGDLIVGSVLVVRNVGLLSTGLSSRRHYLNITANNLVTIYSANSDKSGNPRLHSFSGLNFKDIIVNWRALVSPSPGLGSPAHLGPPSLFNSSCDSPVSSNSVHNPRDLNLHENLSKRTLSNQNSSVIPQNSRSNIAQNIRCATPKGRTVPLAHSRMVGQNLLPLVTHTFHQNSSSSKTGPTRCIIDNRLLQNTNSINSFHRGSVIPPRASTSLQALSNHTKASEVAKGGTFNFSPVIIKPKSANNVFSGLNSENKTNFYKQTETISNVDCEANTSSRINNSKLTLSQESDLTQEEQSVMESVFDGIDADSLFDDDF